MKGEPPDTGAKPGRLGLRKKIKEKIRKIYQNFSYKPQNKQELAGSIRDSTERGVLEKGTQEMMEGALKVSTSQVREIMIPKPQMIFIDSNEEPKDFLPRIIESNHSRFPVINSETDEVEGISLGVEVRTSLVGLGTIPTEDAPTRIRTSACLLEVRETIGELEDEFFVYIHIFTSLY